MTAFASYHNELTRTTIHPRDFGGGNFNFGVYNNFVAGIKFYRVLLACSFSADFIYDSFQDNGIRTLEPVHDNKGFRQGEKLILADLRHKIGNGKLFVGGGMAFQWRSFEQLENTNLRFRPNPFNSRATFSFGLNFRKDALVEFGTSFDLDGDQFYTDRGATRFDGAFGRVVYAMN